MSTEKNIQTLAELLANTSKLWFFVRADGSHVVIKNTQTGTTLLDFWPGSIKYKVRGTKKHVTGMSSLIKFLKKTIKQLEKNDG